MPQGSYVDWLESGGARVVPIPYTMAADDVEALVANLNGVRAPSRTERLWRIMSAS